MYFKIIDDLEGLFETKDKKRVNLLKCNFAYTPRGLNEGWLFCKNQESALKKLGLRLFEEQ